MGAGVSPGSPGHVSDRGSLVCPPVNHMQPSPLHPGLQLLCTPLPAAPTHWEPPRKPISGTGRIWP